MTTRLFHLSDTHFGVEDRAALDNFAETAKAEGADAIICTGDLTQRSTHEEWRQAAEYFAQFEMPVFVCAGNHDMPYANLWERFTDPYRRFRRMKAAVGGVDVTTDDVVIVPFRTTVRAQPRFPWSDGLVMQAALDECLARLAELEGDARLKIVACHHPLLGASDEWKSDTIGGDNAFARLAEAGADAVMSGHVHYPFDLVREREGHSMRMIGTGTLSTRLRGSPPTYSVITCSKETGITVEARALGEM